ncbi:MAG TPA: YceI family protein [Actinomycetota bacterium]|nr:YceI family protein [Actinomycetota bacterium]
MKLPKGKAIAGTLVLVSVVGMGASYLMFFTPEAPPPVSLNSPEDQAHTAARFPESDPTGRWTVKEGSEAGYRVREKLARLPATSEAVGRTSKVSGGFTVSGENGNYTLANIGVEVDMASLQSDSPRRDEALQERGLETNRFPTASFRSPGPMELPDGLTAGEPVDFLLDGALTIHGVTRQASIPVRAQLAAGTLEVVGTLIMHMADFGIEAPSVANIVSVEPTGTMEFNLLLEKTA